MDVLVVVQAELPGELRRVDRLPAGGGGPGIGDHVTDLVRAAVDRAGDVRQRRLVAHRDDDAGAAGREGRRRLRERQRGRVDPRRGVDVRRVLLRRQGAAVAEVPAVRQRLRVRIEGAQAREGDRERRGPDRRRSVRYRRGRRVAGADVADAADLAAGAVQDDDVEVGVGAGQHLHHAGAVLLPEVVDRRVPLGVEGQVADPLPVVVEDELRVLVHRRVHGAAVEGAAVGRRAAVGARPVEIAVVVREDRRAHGPEALRVERAAGRGGARVVRVAPLLQAGRDACSRPAPASRRRRPRSRASRSWRPCRC